MRGEAPNIRMVLAQRVSDGRAVLLSSSSGEIELRERRKFKIEDTIGI